MEIMEQFMQLSAFQKLKELAAAPIDLREALSAERIRKFVAESAGFRCLFAMERVSDEVVEALGLLAEQTHVHEKMEKMQKGEVVNFIEGYASENRPALHTALRDFFEGAEKAKTALQAREMARAEANKLQAFEKRMEPYRHLVMIGIGGSALGPEAIFRALEGQIKPGKEVRFIVNVDPDDAAKALSGLDLKRTLVAVVSKSGTTEETLTNEALVKERFKRAGLDPKEHFIAITGEGSPMDDPSHYLASFYIWDWVGGRFSASSAIGGLIFTFAYGFATYWELLSGAHAMDMAALKRDITENLPLLGALLEVWNRNFLGYSTLAIIPYSAGLSRLAAHIQQVEMESNGKRINRLGEAVDFETAPVIWGEPGTNAQHSFFQMIHQGTSIIPIEFIGFKHSQRNEDLEVEGATSQEKLLSNLMAQSMALAVGQKNSNPNKTFAGNRPSHILWASELNAKTLGALLSYFEHKVAFEGFIWNINSFDQEGVQLGKVLASRFVDLFRKKRGHVKRGYATKTQATPIEAALLEQWERL